MTHQGAQDLDFVNGFEIYHCQQEAEMPTSIWKTLRSNN